ncbi:MAG: ABC transporter permease [Planctomycetota bacterium]|jgi:rhamnose transport system permease protein|nr:ABC transporter permease [Planctomycetota bacterium]
MPEARTISADKPFSWKAFFLQWEWMLLVLFILVQVANSQLSSYYFNFDKPGDSAMKLIDATMTFLDKAFIALPMAFVIIMGEIDISVGSTVALSAVLMGVSNKAGLPMPAAMCLCLAVGTGCGLLNGVILTRFKELAPMIVTLSTMIIYRGIALIILEDQSVGKFPLWFEFLGWEYVGPSPFMLLAFLVCALIYGVVLHKTTFGRQLYAIGSNRTASYFSGVPVDRIRIAVYTLIGLMSGVTALFLTSRMGSTRPNVAQGYELDVIAMVVLGGVSTSGGKGRMIGVAISVFTVGYLRYGLGLRNVSAQVLMIIVGLLLIFAVMVPNLRQMAAEWMANRKRAV